MRKSDAIELFGGVKQLAEALIISPQAVSQWPDELSARHTKQVLGEAVIRYGVRKTRKAFPDITIPFDPPPHTA